jgi:hypothetical protein
MARPEPLEAIGCGRQPGPVARAIWAALNPGVDRISSSISASALAAATVLAVFGCCRGGLFVAPGRAARIGRAGFGSAR